MFKQLMISLFALSLAALWVSEAHARGIYLRRSVSVTVTSNQADDTFVTDIFGLPTDEEFGCGLIRGDVYCLDNSAETDPEACDKSTGYSAALVLVTDLDFIKPKTKPYRWTDLDLNSDLADFGQRRQLRVMEELALSNAFTIELPAGETVNKAGIHGISDGTVGYWKLGEDITVNEALRKFVGTPSQVDGTLTPDEGFGINGEQYLQALPGAGVTPIFGDNLKNLEGHLVCFVSHSDQVTGDDLHGKYRGTFAGKVIYTTNSSVTFEALDSDDVCNLTLYNDYNTKPPGEVVYPGCTKEEDQLVFAPAPCDAVVEYADDAFLEQTGTTSCGDRVCKGTVELELDNATGQLLCPPDTTFKKFIPKNLGGNGDYSGYAFIGVVKDSSNEDLNELVICGDAVPGGEEGVEYSRYGCVPLEDELDPAVIPDCCGCSEWVQVP